MLLELGNVPVLKLVSLLSVVFPLFCFLSFGFVCLQINPSKTRITKTISDTVALKTIIQLRPLSSFTFSSVFKAKISLGAPVVFSADVVSG